MFRGVVRAGCANLIELFVVLPVRLVRLGVGVVLELASWLDRAVVGWFGACLCVDLINHNFIKSV